MQSQRHTRHPLHRVSLTRLFRCGFRTLFGNRSITDELSTFASKRIYTRFGTFEESLDLIDELYETCSGGIGAPWHNQGCSRSPGPTRKRVYPHQVLRPTSVPTAPTRTGPARSPSASLRPSARKSVRCAI